MKNKILYYNPELKEKARNLRKNSTPGEIRLWKYLKKKQLLGYDFHRQKPIGNYIVDFYCPSLMLAIELDGISHNEKVEYDKKRQFYLESVGVKVLRFTEYQVHRDIYDVLISIECWIKQNQNTNHL
jgi:very-short-patch-repair endonuclease